MNIEFNEQFKNSIELLEHTTKNIFITGKAGTGKSTLLKYFKENSKKNMVVLAPTGVSAVNIGGETIHSFFSFDPGINLDLAKKKAQKYRGSKELIYIVLDTIVIDEISMVRSDLLDCMDVFLKTIRRNNLPFGGVQMVFIGDLYQLPPVAKDNELVLLKNIYDSQYFFDSNSFKQILNKNNFNNFIFIELEKVYRQRNEDFIKLLNLIRNNSIEDSDLEMLNKRVCKNYKDLLEKDNECIYLTTINKKAEFINNHYLSKLDAQEKVFEASVVGNFKSERFPTDKLLHLKIGARVMFVNNDKQGRWINGTIGEVVDIRENSVSVLLSNGNYCDVNYHTWDIYKTSYDAFSNSLRQDVVGSFIQIPLKLCWAITIHKSQGKTFKKVIIDLDRGSFAEGQTYVALSRCVSLEGIYLVRPVCKSDIKIDAKVFRFLSLLKDSVRSGLPAEELIRCVKNFVNPGGLFSF